MNRTREEIEEIVVHIRLELYNRGLPCGPRAVRARMRDLDITSGPSVRTIARTLEHNGLTHGRTGIYPGEKIEKQHSLSSPLDRPRGAVQGGRAPSTRVTNQEA